ncbi:MAG: ABC transporter permease [Rhodospirillaceae bacterium]|nr:MAG: ABC transporter permease [Rhodospirillaceae bacterium]
MNADPMPGLTMTNGRDLWRQFCRAPVAMAATMIIVLIVVGAVFAPWIAPQNPFDPAALDLSNALIPPAWMSGGDHHFLLGTDDQGRDVLSALLYGTRVSLAVGIGAVVFAAVLGIASGLLAGWRGGIVETLVMRLADVQLTIPAILIALMIDALARATLSPGRHEEVALGVLIFAIGIADWPQYARTMRTGTAVQKTLGYVRAARIIGVKPITIVLRHILPNVLTSVTVLATLGLALAIISEATLSFLGVGMPPTTPSLGTLIRVGQNFLFSGEWWIVAFPSLVLVIMALAVNLLGDWLRDALDPRLV